eukprot:6777_1
MFPIHHRNRRLGYLMPSCVLLVMIMMLAQIVVIYKSNQSKQIALTNIYTETNLFYRNKRNISRFQLTATPNIETNEQNTEYTTHWCHSRDLLQDNGKRASCVFKNLCVIKTPNSSHEIEWLYVSQQKPKDTSFTLGIGPHSVDKRLYFEPIHSTKQEFESLYPLRLREYGTSVAFYEYNAENFGHMLTDVLMPIYTALQALDMYTNEVKLFRYSIKDSIGFSCDFQINANNNLFAKQNCERMYKMLFPLLSKHPIKILNASVNVPICFDTLVVGMSQYSDDCLDGGHGRTQSEWSLCNHGQQKQFWNFRCNILINAGVNNDPPTSHQIVVTNRTTKRRRLHNFDDLVVGLRSRYGAANVLVVEWQKLTIVEQLDIISKTTVHLTPPGGISFISMFLPRWATSIRLYPNEFMLEWHLFNYLGYIHPEYINCPHGQISVDSVVDLVQKGFSRFESMATTKMKTVNIQSIIPKTIYHSWITAVDMPIAMKSNLNKWITLNPEYKIVFFNDTEQREWMKQECRQYFPAWKSMQLAVARADLFRYCLLWIEGGVWSDVDIVPLQSLKNIIDSNVDLLVVHDGGMGKGFLYNAFFAVKPSHPILKRAMDIINENYQKRLRKGAVWVTGPKVLWRALNDTQYAVNNHQKIQYLSFHGNAIRDKQNEIVMNAKYSGYLKDASTNGGEPHYGRVVVWK